MKETLINRMNRIHGRLQARHTARAGCLGCFHQRFLKSCRFLVVLVGVAGLCLLAAGCGRREEDGLPKAGKSSVWRVEKNGKELYLAGTIHLLREQDHPLPAAFEEAYRASRRMIFELPPGSDDDAMTAHRMQEMGTYGPGGELAQDISVETMKLLEAWAQRRGQPLEAFAKMRPWMLALTIAAVEYQLIGAEARRGVDNYFEKRAKQDGKPGSGLETVEFQLGIFAGLSKALQEELLLQTLKEAEAISRDFEALLHAWREGDAEKLQAFLFRDAEKYPELTEAFLVRRNRQWVAPLLQALEGGETAMALVGAGHLGGKHGLIALLEAQGCRVQPVMAGDEES